MEVEVERLSLNVLLSWVRVTFSFAPRGLQRRVPPSRRSAVLPIVALARVCPLYQYRFMYVCAGVL